MSSATLKLIVPAYERTDTSFESFRLGYRPALDGVRGVAILGVLAVHTNHVFGWSMLKGGNIGVDLFFVLSGFLITCLLLEEWERKGSISLKRFYFRRVLRLFPALLTLLFVLGLTAPYILSNEEATQTLRAIPIALTYSADFAIAFFNNPPLGTLKHTWSLAIEEQFYIVWPVVLLVSLRCGVSKRALISCTLLAIAVIALHRAALWDGGGSIPRSYYSVDTRADSLLAGCVLAMLISWGWVRSVGSRLTALATMFILLCMVATNYATPLMYLGGFTLLAAASAVLITGVLLSSSRLSGLVLENSALVWVGRVSYGIYLWHYPVFKAIAHIEFSWPTQLCLAVTTTFALATLSFYLIESPLLRLKERRAYLTT